MEEKTKKKKITKKTEIEYCNVCKLHHEQGPRHKYFPRHKDSLSTFLDRFKSKLTDVRFFLRNPTLLRPQEESQNRLWCVFCELDLVEIGSSFACAKAITHFASLDHLKNVKGFVWKHGPGMDCVDDFRFSESDVAKWRKKCESLSNEDALGSNDIQNKLAFETMDRIENVGAHRINLNDVVMPLQCNTNEYQISSHPEVVQYGSFPNMDASHLPISIDPLSHLPGNGFDKRSIPCGSKSYSGNGNYSSQENNSMCQDKKQVVGSYSSPGVVGMTSISSLHPTNDSGNVHSGAPPPWLDANDGSVSNVQLNQSEACSLQNISGKTSKLNPKRVGAAWAERRKTEMEMEKRGQEINSNTDADWLPNFGRVWQSGSRKESRKEFEKEKRKLVKTDSISMEPEPVQIQPYISKRARRESGE